MLFKVKFRTVCKSYATFFVAMGDEERKGYVAYDIFDGFEAVRKRIWDAVCDTASQLEGELKALNKIRRWAGAMDMNEYTIEDGEVYLPDSTTDEEIKAEDEEE